MPKLTPEFVVSELERMAEKADQGSVNLHEVLALLCRAVSMLLSRTFGH